MNDLSTGEAATDAVLQRTDADRVALLTLNRPRQYNALSAALLDALHRELDAIAADESVRVVMITGAGAAFCSGHDLKEMRALADRAAVERLFFRCSAMMQKLVALPQPTIAVVNGLATAAGCQLVAQCDLAVASTHARFAASGINLGLFCSTPAVPLSRNLSRKRAAEMLFTGEFIEAAVALDWGLVNRVSPPERPHGNRARAREQPHREAPRGARPRQGALLPPARGKPRGCVRRCIAHHRIEHGCRDRSRGCGRFLREALPALESLTPFTARR
jgi:enoyl-CoA hydratase/carnithine racemase